MIQLMGEISSPVYDKILRNLAGKPEKQIKNLKVEQIARLTSSFVGHYLSDTLETYSGGLDVVFAGLILSRAASSRITNRELSKSQFKYQLNLSYALARHFEFSGETNLAQRFYYLSTMIGKDYINMIRRKDEMEKKIVVI